MTDELTPEQVERYKRLAEPASEREYRAAYAWFLRNDEDPDRYDDDAQQIAARNQRELVSDRLMAAREKAAAAGVTSARMDEIEAEDY